MSNKIQNCLSIDSIKKVDHLIEINERTKRETTFNNSNLLTNDSIFDEIFSVEHSTIYTAIENFIDGQKWITFGNHEKAYICLIRFLTIAEKLIGKDVKQTEDYYKNRDIYDYYLSERLKSQTIEKLEFLSTRVNIHRNRDKDGNRTDIPKDMSLASNGNKCSNIFDFNYLIKSQNYNFGSQKLIKLKNQWFRERNSSIRRSKSMDMGLDSNFNDIKPIPESQEVNPKELNSIERIEKLICGYNEIIAPLVMDQTLRRIEENKRNIELKAKSKDFVEYSWQRNRKNYIIKALKI